jgi:hypothetical protein
MSAPETKLDTRFSARSTPPAAPRRGNCARRLIARANASCTASAAASGSRVVTAATRRNRA